MDRTFGVDVSLWNGNVNFVKMAAAGANFVFCKASQQITDIRFVENWKGARDAGLLRGAYHYLDWRKSEMVQAQLFVSLLKSDPGELPPVLDLEMNPAPYGLTAALVSGKAWNFMTFVERELGRTPMLYSGYPYWNSWGSNNISWTHFPFWLAWYEPEWYIRFRGKGTGAPLPWKNWAFWQYKVGGNGPYYGSSGLNIDMNVFNGSLADLKKFAVGTPVIPPTVLGWFKVTSLTLKVFAGPADTYRQVATPLPKDRLVNVLSLLTSTSGEKWANIESPAGWVRFTNLTKV